MKKKYIVSTALGLVVMITSVILPYLVGIFMYLSPNESNAVGIIGGSGWPTAIFRAKQILGSIPLILMIVGIVIVIVCIVFLMISRRK